MLYSQKKQASFFLKKKINIREKKLSAILVSLLIFFFKNKEQKMTDTQDEPKQQSSMAEQKLDQHLEQKQNPEAKQEKQNLEAFRVVVTVNGNSRKLDRQIRKLNDVHKKSAILAPKKIESIIVDSNGVMVNGQHLSLIELSIFSKEFIEYEEKLLPLHNTLNRTRSLLAIIDTKEKLGLDPKTTISNKLSLRRKEVKILQELILLTQNTIPKIEPELRGNGEKVVAKWQANLVFAQLFVNILIMQEELDNLKPMTASEEILLNQKCDAMVATCLNNS